MIRTRKEVREVECIETIECDHCKREVCTGDGDWTDGYYEFIAVRHRCG